MTWTDDKIMQVPEEYRDFMLTLKPVIDSKRPDTILRINGIPFGRIVALLTSRYEYTADDVRQLADVLRQKGLVNEDNLGFFVPTGEGEAFIHALAPENGNGSQSRVPPFPAFKE